MSCDNHAIGVRAKCARLCCPPNRCRESAVGWSTSIRPCQHKNAEISAGHQLGIRLSKRQLLEETFTRIVGQVWCERADGALRARSARQPTWRGPSRESPRQLVEPRK